MAFKNLRVFSSQLTDNEATWVQLGTGGVVNLKETTTPTSIPGYGKLYVKSSDSRLYFLDDSGVEYDLLAGSGVTTFLGLTDTPSSYTGEGGKFVRVKATEDGLEFATVSGGGGGYATIQEEGISLTQRTVINFIGDGITASDDAANSRTNITLDATLNSISNLGTAADKTIYTTGINTWAETPLTAFGRSLIDDIDAATARGTLGLGSLATKNIIATSDIDNSAVTYAKIQNVSETDKILGRMSAGAGVIEEITCTAAGRDLLDDDDAATQRTTLGLGTIATQNADAVSITGGSITGITDLAVADGGTGASDAATARFNLGLVIGTNVQAHSTNLDTWATKTAPSGVVIGDTDTQSLSNKRFYPRQNIQTSPTSITPDKSQYDEYYVTALANAITINNATSPSVGDIFVIYLTDNGTARSISFGTNYAAIGAALPTTTTASKTMEIIIKYVTTSVALVSYNNQV